MLLVLAVCLAALAAAGARAAGGRERVSSTSRRASSQGTARQAAAIEREAALLARSLVGVRYRWGGISPATGFDCSGLVAYVYSRFGVSLPHNAAAQWSAGRPVARSELRPGDLLFFDRLGHVAVYLGGGRFVNATHTGGRVEIQALSNSWFGSTFMGARRPVTAAR